MLKRSLPIPPDLIRDALAGSAARVVPLTHDGQKVWIKRLEHLSLLRRLQKGSAVTTFETEREALRELAGRGLPVPEILAEGPEFFVIPDCGPSLDHLLRGVVPTTDAERLDAFAAAGRALAEMHRAHFSHGRPSLRDVCWLSGRATFVDFERFAAFRNTAEGHAEDLVLFVFNGITLARGLTPELSRAIESYRAEDPDHIWERAQDWCRRRRWINIATKPIQWRREGKSKEFKAIPKTLEVFGAI